MRKAVSVLVLSIAIVSGLQAQDSLREFSGKWYTYDHFLIYRSVDGGRLSYDNYRQSGPGLEGPFTAEFLPNRRISLVKFRGEKEIVSWEPGRNEPCFYTVDRLGVKLKHTFTPIGPGRYLAVVEEVAGASNNHSFMICIYSRER